MLEMDQEPDGQVVLTSLKKLGNELYLAGSLSRTNVESSHETSLIQFNKKKTTTDQWTSGMQCYWCWKLGHKSSDCKRRPAGEPKLPKPGSKIRAAPGGGGKTQAPCGRCKGKHLTKHYYHDPANASKRPAGWIVRTKDVGTVAIDSDSSDSFVKVHKPDFSIIAVERPSQASNNGLWLIDTGAVPTIAEKAVELVTIKPVNVSTLGGEIKLIKPDFFLVAIDSSAAQPELAIDAQLLLIHDRVNSGHMTFPDNFDLLYDKNIWIFDTGASSCIWCGYFKQHPIVPELVAAAPVKAIAPAAPAAKLIKMPIMKAHDLLGHGDQEKTKATAVALGWTICRGGWCRCVHCAKAKAKRRNIPKDTDHEKAEKPGGCIFTDITSV
jgi:hypothetical protein